MNSLWRFTLYLAALLVVFSSRVYGQLGDDCLSDELHYLPRLPDFFDYVPIRQHAAQLTTEIDADIDALLNQFSELESTCLCNATKVNRIIMDNARLCPRTSSNIAFDTQHCVREPTSDRSMHSWTSSAEFTSVDSFSNSVNNGRHGNRPGGLPPSGGGGGSSNNMPPQSHDTARGSGVRFHGNQNNWDTGNRLPGILDNRWLRNTTSITPMTSRQSTSNINLHILIGIVVISAILIIVLFGSMVWWMRKRTEFTTTHPFSGDCKRWFSWCNWSTKDLALRDTPVNGPFNNPVFCVGHDGGDDREDVMSSSFESSQKRDSGYVGCINGVPVLDLQMSPYRCYRPLRTEAADLSRDADDDLSYADESDSADTESVIVTPSSHCSFITFNLDTSRDQILKPPLQTSV